MDDVHQRWGWLLIDLIPIDSTPNIQLASFKYIFGSSDLVRHHFLPERKTGSYKSLNHVGASPDKW